MEHTIATSGSEETDMMVRARATQGVYDEYGFEIRQNLGALLHTCKDVDAVKERQHLQ